MPRLEATLLRSSGTPIKLWSHELTVDQSITLAQVAGVDDGLGGLVTLGVAQDNIPEIDYKNVSGQGYHALMKWDGNSLSVSRRTKPKKTTNGFLTAKGTPTGDTLSLKLGEAFRIARFLFTLVSDQDSSPASLPYATAPAKAIPTIPPPLPKVTPSRLPSSFENDRSEPDLNISVPPEQLHRMTDRKSMKLSGSGMLPSNKSNDEMALGEEEVLSTRLTDSDNVINGLLEIVDRFDPTQSMDKLDELFRQAIRRAVPIPEAAADVIVLPPNGDPRQRGKEKLPWFSRTFVRDALKQVGQNGGVLAGIWKSEGQSGIHAPLGSVLKNPTSTSGVLKSGLHSSITMPGWAVCAPVRVRTAHDEQLALYVSAPMPDPGRELNLATDPGVAQAQKVVLLFSKLYAALAQMSRMSVRYQDAVAFLPKPVQKLLNQPNYDQQLAPRTLDVTVLFCDLRGSCGFADAGSDDLAGQWKGVFQNALEQMSRAINDNGGVIGGYIGDAVMGFWGWPDATTGEIQIRKATRAALAIRENFERLRQNPDAPTADMRIGIGLTHGPALVGKLGNYDMKKIDVFGPTVNRAARIEAMTKRFGVEIIVDEKVASGLGDSRTVDGRLRRLARVSPAGMDEPFNIFELVPSEVVEAGFGAKEHIFEEYQQALYDFEMGEHWDNARAVLERHADRDGPSRFLLTMLEKHHSPPDDWPRDNDLCYIKLVDK
jgi:class 3 adenylate cyclase